MKHPYCCDHAVILLQGPTAAKESNEEDDDPNHD